MNELDGIIHQSCRHEAVVITARLTAVSLRKARALFDATHIDAGFL